ncbi:MAG: hypothetical protein J1F05_03650 [Muribaculaceae bacterium]|nr:hypothetical protein [Muribaculaceae bacterium]
MKYQRLVLMIVAALSSIWAMAIDLKVGEATTLDAGRIERLDKCQWSISRPDAVAFVSTPGTYTTSVEVKANKALADTPCIIECVYYYSEEIDPRTGRQMFTRKGTKRWELEIKE